MAGERDDDKQENRRGPSLIQNMRVLPQRVLYNDQLVLLVLAIVAAAASAYGAIAFRELYLSTQFLRLAPFRRAYTAISLLFPFGSGYWRPRSAV
jgi:hypothetical protein